MNNCEFHTSASLIYFQLIRKFDHIELTEVHDLEYTISERKQFKRNFVLRFEI